MKFKNYNRVAFVKINSVQVFKCLSVREHLNTYTHEHRSKI